LEKNNVMKEPAPLTDALKHMKKFNPTTFGLDKNFRLTDHVTLKG